MGIHECFPDMIYIFDKCEAKDILDILHLIIFITEDFKLVIVHKSVFCVIKIQFY